MIINLVDSSGARDIDGIDIEYGFSNDCDLADFYVEQGRHCLHMEILIGVN